MELIVISDKKLKIILDDGELASRGIALDELECEDERYADEKRETNEKHGIDEKRSIAKAALRGILDEARDKTGFDASHAKVYIQLYPSRGGGCEIYVTKLSECADDYPVKPASHKRAGHILPPEEHRGPGEVCYAFESLDNLCGACKRLAVSEADLGSTGVKSSVLRDEYGRYLLVISEEARASCEETPVISENAPAIPEYFRRGISCLGDYGQRLKRDLAASEHSELLRSGDAIELFAGL